MDTQDINRRFARLKDAAAAGRAQQAEALRELRGLLAEVRDARGRGTVNQHIWDCERALGARDTFFSQSGQDAWLDEHLFNGKRGGVFVEIGGHDGVTGSNCLFFELRRGWRGLLVEPSPARFPLARAARRCPCHQVALAAREGEAEYLEIRAGLTQMGGLVANYDAAMRAAVEADPRHRGEVIRVPTRTLAGLLDDAGLREIDYVSLDVEGAEMAVLQGFDFERFRVQAWTVENNRGDTAAIPRLMQAKGYRRAEALGADDVYLLQGL